MKREKSAPMNGDGTPSAVLRTAAIVLAALVLLPAAGTAAGRSGETGESGQKDERRERISVDGYWFTKFREYGASGNESRFLSQEGLLTYGSRMEQGADMSILFEFGRSLRLSGRVYDLPYREREMTFDLSSGHLKATLGDFVASLQGGAFANFSKKITGTMLEYRTGRAAATFVTSEVKSLTKTESFRGRNIKGPYDIRGVELIPEKIQVKINGEIIPASEYVLEPFQGDITFFEVITPSDYVTITYEQTFRTVLGVGNITGYGAEYGARNKRWKIGATRIVQEASRAVHSLIEQVASEPAAPDPLDPTLLALPTLRTNNGLLVRSDGRTTETIVRNGVTLEKYNDYNVANTSEGAAELLGLEAQGFFRLASVPSATSSFTVSYLYYPESITGGSDDEVLTIDTLTNDAVFREATVYYGSEEIRGCNSETESIDSCGKIFTREVDYYVVESENRAIFKNTSYTLYNVIKARYRTYPAFLPSGSLFDQTVTNYGAEYRASDKLAVRADLAISNADIAAKPIQVFGRIIGAAAAEITCPSGAAPDPCTFSLGNTDVSTDSDRVYFNDVTSLDAIRTRHADYTVNYDVGEITFLKSIPAGTTIIADYSYTPPEVGVEKGHIIRTNLDYKTRKTSLNLLTQNANTFFTPIGGEANLETSRLNLTGAHSFSDGLRARFSFLSLDTALDVLGANKTKNTQQRMEISYSSRKIPSLTLTRGSRTLSDDYAAPRVDSRETVTGLQASLPVPYVKNTSFDLGWEKTEFTEDSLLSATPDSETSKRVIGVHHKRGKKLTADARFTTSSYDSATVTGEQYTTTISGRNVKITYVPAALVSLNASVDKQTTSDSRPSTQGEEINSTTLTIRTNPIWRLQFLSLSHSKRDRPSLNTPSSSTTSTTYASSLKLSPSANLNPSHTVTTTSVGGSGSRSRIATYELEFRPAGRPYNLTLSTQKSTSDSSSGSLQTSRSVTRNQARGSWYPSGKLSFITSLEKEKSSSGSAGSYDGTLMNFKVTHKPSEKKTQWLIYNVIDRTGAIGERYATWTVGLSHRVTKLLVWNFEWRRSSFGSSADGSQNFTGTKMETELKAEF
ncbi:MAG: hypothetical protein AB1742_12520 [bacterium]